MIVKTVRTSEVNPEQLAEALARSTPQEFAKFWFEFNKICEDQKINLDAFAEAMAEELGGSRKKPLNYMYDYMKYLEIEKRRKQ